MIKNIFIKTMYRRIKKICTLWIFPFVLLPPSKKIRMEKEFIYIAYSVSFFWLFGIHPKGNEMKIKKNIQVWKITPILCKTFLFFFFFACLAFLLFLLFWDSGSKILFFVFSFFPHSFHSFSIIFVCLSMFVACQFSDVQWWWWWWLL